MQPAQTMESFVAQRRHGVDTHGAARRDIRSEQRDERKKHSDTDECDWVRGADSKKETGQKARDDEGCSNANAHAENREPSTFAHDQTQYLPSLRAERHANADLLGAPRNRKGHNSIDADCRKSQSSGSKQSHEKKKKTAIREPAAHFIREGGEFDGNIGSEIAENAARRGNDLSHWCGAAHKDRGR